MGSLLTTSDGDALKELTAGQLNLDFVNGTITRPNGVVENMNISLDAFGLNQCGSIGIWCSDADAQIIIGTNFVIADHQLTHIINNYDFSNVRVVIPANSTPDENQVAFIASTDHEFNYVMNNYAHDRDEIDGTTTNVDVVYYSKHTGAYDSMYYTVQNTHGSNSLDFTVEFSENGIDFFPDQGFVTPVIVASNSYSAFATTNEHHFYRILLKSTSSGNHATFKIFYNNVSSNN
tara:strand:- start:881 stop:1582 length:702 start_codon:yes stop_codon:yes gene_type:complete